MYRPVITLLFIVAAVGSSHAAVTIDSFTTTPEWIDPATANSTLVSFTDATGTYINPQSATSLAGNEPGTVTVWGEAGVQPASAADALTDNLVDTGVLNSGDDVIYNLARTIAAGDRIFVFFDGTAGGGVHFDQPSTITALDVNGDLVGSAVDVPDLQLSQVGTANLARSEGSVLGGRGIYAFSLDADEFGGDLSAITGVRLASTPDASQTDVHMVGVATLVPEPTSVALGGLTILGLLAVRRRY